MPPPPPSQTFPRLTAPDILRNLALLDIPQQTSDLTQPQPQTTQQTLFALAELVAGVKREEIEEPKWDRGIVGENEGMFEEAVVWGAFVMKM